MSFSDEYLKLRNKRKKEEKTTTNNNSYAAEYSKLRANRTAEEQQKISEAEQNSALAWRDDEIAPVRTDRLADWRKARDFSLGSNKDTYFKQGKGTVAENIAGSIFDFILGVEKGGMRTIEGIGDAISYGAAGVTELFGNEEKAEEIRRQAQESQTDNVYKKQIFMGKPIDKFADEYSYLGQKSDAVAEGIGQAILMVGTGGAASAAGLGTVGTTLVTTGITATSGIGSGMGEAYAGGASDKEAFKYGLLKGGIEAGSELMFGGLGKASKAIGIGKSAIPLDDFFANAATKKVTNNLAKTLIQYGIKATGEGVEEVVAGYLSAHAKKGTYMPEKDFSEILKDEKLLESFIAGTLTSAVMQTGSAAHSIKTGTDFITGYTQNEQSVIDKEVENRVAEQEKNGKKLTKREIGKIEEQVQNDLDKGYISIDTIESTLGGKTFEEYKFITDKEKALTDEISQLEGMPDNQITVKQRERLTAARKELESINKTELKTRLNDEVFALVKDSRLAESYNEKARRGQAFEADLSQYDEKQRVAVERAIKSGVLNNTNRSHELVNILSKIEADKGIVFDYTNNAKLKESGFALEGKTVNGFVKNGNVTLNVQSQKAWQSTVGHEITHILEGTDSYGALQEALFKYAESKGELESRRTALTELYKDMDADIDAELTADLVGDYLFTDKNFINNLTGNRTLFQKVYDEIKYLCKVATGKELTEIEKVKQEFDKAWKEMSVNANAKADEKINYSLNIKHTDGSVEELADARSLTNEQAISYLNQAKSGKLKWDTYIPVRKDTPQVIIDTLKKAGESVDNRSLVMQVRKAQQSMSKQNKGSRKVAHGNNTRGHALAPEEVAEIINNLDNPTTIILQTNRYNEEGKPLPNNVAVFVEYNNNGNEGMAVIEFESSIDEEFVGTEFGDTEFHTVVTLFEPDVERDGMPFDYAEELLLNPNNYELEIEKRQPTGSAIGKKHPNTSSELPLSEDILTQNSKKSSENTKFSLFPETDAEYMSAVERGDTETAQRLVEKTANDLGYSIRAYHGTGYDFTIFDKSKQGDNYQDWGRLGKGFYFAPTSREAETWAELSKGAKNKVMPVYLRSENMLDSFEALPDDLKDTIPENWDGLTRRLAEKYAYNYIEYMQEFGYNVQEILTEKGYDGINGHTEFVVFNPEQVKSAEAITYDDKGNVIPLSQRFNAENDDIRFSLSESVEETKDLVAVHNLQSSELVKTLELGGLAMPSIAVIKAEQGHEKYGDVSLVFPKEAIDPKASTDNKVYGGDAWTPTHPRLEYKANESVQQKIRDKYYDLADKVGYDAVRPLYRYVSELEGALNSKGGESALLEELYDDTKMMQVYLEDSGKGKVEDIIKETRTEATETEREMNQWFIDKLGEDVISSFKAPEGVSPFTHRKEFMAQYGEQAKQAYREFFAEKFGFDEETLNNIIDKTQAKDIVGFIKNAEMYLRNDGVTVKTETDYAATENAIKEKASDGYKAWVDNLFKGVEEKTGIRNDKDLFTSNGNRRSWDALHWENTLENVVRLMKTQDQTGADAFTPYSALFAVAHKNYGSVDEIKADSHRLGRVSEEEYKAMESDYASRLAEIATSIKDPNEKNSFVATDEAAELIVDAVRNYKTKTAMLRYMQKYNSRVTAKTVENISALVADIANMPTGYFEAKPQRAVGLEEVGVFVIPNNADVKLKQELLNKGYSIAEYDPNVEGDRKRVVNQFEEYKFSLSNVGDQFAPIGNYSTPINETALELPKNENTSKVGTVSKNAVVDDAPFFTEYDAPPEMEGTYYEDNDTTALDNKALKNIGKSLRDTLALTAQETKAIQEIVQEYSTSETKNTDTLFDTIKEKFGEKVWKVKSEEIAEVKRFLRDTKVNVSPYIKSSIADYSAFRKSIGGKVGISKDGLPVDTAYQQLVEMYPAFFSEEITNEADQFLRMVEVANTDLYETESYQLDDNTIQEAVNIISNEVKAYKQNLTRIAAEETAREALDSIAPLKAEQIADGSRGDALLNQSLDNFPIKTVADRLTEKIRAVEAELTDNKHLRREAEVNYNKQIEKLQEEYAALKDKSTKKANNIVKRVIKLERLKASVDADYAKRISDLEARVEKMNDPQYSRAMHKQDKMQEHAKWAENLLGDTSTWVDKKLGLQYSTNTERRNLRDIVRDANGNVDIAKADAIDDALNGQYNREEAAKKRELSQTRGKYAELKITKAEDAYIQMLGELRHNPDTALTEKVVNEYYENHKNKIDTKKVEKVIELARQDYDNFLNRVNAELRKQGMKEIPYRQGYFPHFTEPKQNFIQKLLNWKTQDNEIPTSIAGLTEEFKPVKSWQSFDKTRYSDETDYSFTKGFDTYSQGVLDWIYHLDTLQKRRAVENHIRYTHSDEGIRARIEAVYANEEFDANEAQAQIEHILTEAKNPLNNFVQDFTTHTNILAGKKNSLDRTMEQSTNRHIYSVMTNVQNRMSANMVLANVRSALTNFIPITQSWAQVSPMRSLQATKDTIANAIKDDGTIEKSTFLTNRLREPDNLHNTAWDKVLDKAGIMFEIVDNFSSQVIWRSKYIDNIKNGMTESQAIKNADQFAESVMAGRSKGNEPTLFNAKNPLVKAFTMFQLEVNNQYGYLFKDVPNDLKAETNHWKFNLAKGYTTAFIGAYVYNALLEKVAGSGAALDPISIIEDLLRDLGLFGDDEEKEADEVIMNLVKNVGEELPFVGGTVFGGGRIPISSALPYGDNGLIDGVGDFVGDVTDGNWENVGKEMMNPLLNIGLPVGGGQLKKTVQGLKMFNTDEEHPIAGSYTDSGSLRFPVDDTLGNRIQAGIFGQYASKNAREYFDNGYAPLKEKQIQEYADVDLPIADYWKYREGLKGLKTNAEKADYINSLDIKDWQKNLLMNNILDRKEDVDMSNYDNYANFEEFDFAEKNPEKYAFFKENGISYTDYANADEDGKNAYTWAYNNPEKYKVSKVVANNVIEYRSYTSDLYDIKADKDAYGETIVGSGKEKKIEYINNLDLDYGQKIVLFKMQYKSDDTYNADIIEYINNLDNLTYEERVTIYTELGFTVKDGYVYWD